MKRVIFHVDVNSAFLSWEACYRIHHLGGSLQNPSQQRNFTSRLEKRLFLQKKNVQI